MIVSVTTNIMTIIFFPAIFPFYFFKSVIPYHFGLFEKKL
jgi:hypothetical protein